jgi:hypothetical protein
LSFYACFVIDRIDETGWFRDVARALDTQGAGLEKGSRELAAVAPGREKSKLAAAILDLPNGVDRGQGASELRMG